MSYVADLHLHSSYAYATSSALSLENLAAWARLKGIDLLASADFTHPVWFQELLENLVQDSSGLYRFGGVRFVLGTEVSCVYHQGGLQRRVHILLFAPDFDAVGRLNDGLVAYGGLARDGRPTLGLSARELAELALEADPRCIIVPAHVWTPWYGVYGSKSGFDSLEECFGDMMPVITAVETGLSSDPAMNWSVPDLANKTIVSFSDAHSLPKLGREVTVFEGNPTYQNLAQALSQNRVEYTVEFYPQEGKYHFDGHRKCRVSLAPEDTLRQGDRCPICGRSLTLGVLHRTMLLGKAATEPVTGKDGFIRSPDGRPPFIRLLPLQEIIAEILGQSPNTKRVQAEYQRLVMALGSELRVLAEVEPDALEKVAGEKLAQGILMARTGAVHMEPGYDGVFGKVSLEFPQHSPSLEGHSSTEPRAAGL